MYVYRPRDKGTGVIRKIVLWVIFYRHSMNFLYTTYHIIICRATSIAYPSENVRPPIFPKYTHRPFKLLNDQSDGFNFKIHNSNSQKFKGTTTRSFQILDFHWLTIKKFKIHNSNSQKFKGTNSRSFQILEFHSIWLTIKKFICNIFSVYR